jgi:hypothetical protein
LVSVFSGLHRGESDGLVLQGLVREEPGEHTQAFPCHQGLVPRLPLPHALAGLGLAPGRNASLVKAADLQSAVEVATLAQLVDHSLKKRTDASSNLTDDSIFDSSL